MNTSVCFVLRGIVLSACLSLSFVSHSAEVESANTSSEAFVPVELAQQITHVQPMTGLVMWTDSK